jgi:hypothetical protein
MQVRTGVGIKKMSLKNHAYDLPVSDSVHAIGPGATPFRALQQD